MCCNRMLAEHNLALLRLWDGHANVKFAGHVNLFEYLYKYVFKGPDFARYALRSEPSDDEITDWLLGRYLCATECAWRIFGFQTYMRSPAVYCLPVHLEAENWVTFQEGHEAAAIEKAASKLQQYFWRPTGHPFADLLYCEYFETYMVSAICPKKHRASFPELFPESAGGISDLDASMQAVLDNGPPGKRCFVYPRARSDNLLCSVELKFPQQGEVFFLRHVLLNYTKTSFHDCRVHGGVEYATFEATMQATGRFSKDNECDAIMKELIDLRYTARQLRFVFVLLLDQVPGPNTFYKCFSNSLMKDFTDKGHTKDHACKCLQAELTRLWMEGGHAQEKFPLEFGVGESVILKENISFSAAEKKHLRQLVSNSPDQQHARTTIAQAVASGVGCFFHVNGRSGTGKSTLANCLTGDMADENISVINVATTGQAALHLRNGATAHSTFGIVTAEEDGFPCTVTAASLRGKILAATRLVQWDEWPMARRADWESVLELFRTLKESLPEVYVEKVVVCYGDFRQIPPVIPGGNRDDIVQASVRMS